MKTVNSKKTAKVVTPKVPANRVKMTKADLMKERFQTLTKWLKADLNLLFVGETKVSMATKLASLYTKLRVKKA